MPYVIQRESGEYVAPPGLPKSYTRKLELARTYSTRAAATAEACSNETVLDVADLLRAPS